MYYKLHLLVTDVVLQARRYVLEFVNFVLFAIKNSFVTALQVLPVVDIQNDEYLLLPSIMQSTVPFLADKIHANCLDRWLTTRSSFKTAETGIPIKTI